MEAHSGCTFASAYLCAPLWRRDSDGRAWRNPAWCPWQPHLASALAPTAPGQAVGHARDAARRTREFGAASTIDQALHTLAEVTGGPAALPLYAEAVAHLEQSPAAYEPARAQVGHGAALSRNGRLQEAAYRLYQGLEGAVHCGAEAPAPGPGQSSRRRECVRCRCGMRCRTRWPPGNAAQPNCPPMDTRWRWSPSNCG